MSLPNIVILDGKDEGLGSFLRKEGLHVIRLQDIDSLKERLLKEEIGVVLIKKEAIELPMSSLYKLLMDISPDTKVIIFGSGSKDISPYWIYEYIKWPTEDKRIVLETIKNGILEYALIKRQRIFMERMLFSEDTAHDRRYHNASFNKDILEILRSFNIELSTCRDSKRAMGITKVYIQKLFEPSFFCSVLKLNGHFKIIAFTIEDNGLEQLEKFIKNLIILYGVLSEVSIKKGDIEAVYINGKKVQIEFEIEPNDITEYIGSYIVFPLIAGGDNLGCISIYKMQKDAFNVEDIRRFSFVAYQLANILLNIKLISQIKDISIKDSLTELYNRRYFDEILQHEYLRAKRYHLPLSLIMIDIDYFKSVNDTFGHLVGDQVLKELAILIRKSVRQVDIVARFGGEEFAIILLNTSLEEAAHMAERLRGIVERHPIRVNSNRINITISGGVSTLKRETTSKDILVDQADKALLKAKASGRNKIYMYIRKNEIKEVKAKGLRERRRFKRLPMEFSLSYIPLTIHSIKGGEAISKDISEEGISFRNSQEIPKGEFILLDFELPIKKRKIKALAQIVWSKKEGEKTVMGARLITLNPEDRTIIRQLISQKENKNG